MQVLIDPNLGGIYRYSRRKDSIVHITNTLGLPVGDGKTVELSLEIPRPLLQIFVEAPGNHEIPRAHGLIPELFRWVNPYYRPYKHPLEELAYTIERTLVNLLLTGRKLPHRKPVISVGLSDPSLLVPLSYVDLSIRENIWPFSNNIDTSGIKIKILRKDIPLLKGWLQRPSPKIWDRKQIILLFFLDMRYLQLALKPSRGVKRAGQLLSSYLPDAYLACWELVILSREDSILKRRISKILALLRTDPRANRYLASIPEENETLFEEAAMVCLVYWAFYGEWDKCGIAPLRAPRDIRDQYLRMRRLEPRVSQLRAAKGYPDIWDEVLKRWCYLYLGNPGSAAKTFHLP